MDKRILVFAIAVGLAAQVDAAELRRVENPIQGQYIVVFKDGGEASVNGERRAPPASVADR
ncbi:MAG TPA: hypothetical protein DDZ76_06565, partial [Xanthomonadales bacterium]|nr:hypothetical protein [Xanthomonadales bacterium]